MILLIECTHRRAKIFRIELGPIFIMIALLTMLVLYAFGTLIGMIFGR